MTPKIDNALTRAGFTVHERDNLKLNFLANMADLHNYGSMLADFELYANAHIKKREADMLVTIYSLRVEQVKDETFRAIVFETDWQGHTTVNNIYEGTKRQVLSMLRDCPHVDHVHVGGNPLKVRDPVSAAFALIPVE